MSVMKHVVLKGLLVLILLFAVPYFALIGYFAYFNKDFVYLRGGGPAWMVNPSDDATVDGFPTNFPSTYKMEFWLSSQPESAHININAVESHELVVNGISLSDKATTAKKNWKDATGYDIADYLDLGDNTVVVRVESPYSLTALRTKGEVLEESGWKVTLDSGPYWQVSSDKPFPKLNIAADIPYKVCLLKYWNFFHRIKASEYWPRTLYLFGGSALVILLMLILPGVFRGADGLAARALPGALKTEIARKALYAAGVAAVFIALAVALGHNLAVYEAKRSGDFIYHVEYLKHFLKTWRVPLATEGFMMYNPPLHYMLSAALARAIGGWDVVRWAQTVSTVSTFFTVVFLFLMIRRLADDRAVTFLALCVAAFFPILIYRAPSVTGDSLTALLCTATFYLWLLYAEGGSRRYAVYAGAVTGLGFLTRYTALFPMLGILAGFIYLAVTDRRTVKARAMDAAVYVLPAAVIPGWFYVRNIVRLHTLFPVNGTPGIFFFRQVPGLRDWDFYTNVWYLLVNNPLHKENVMESFLSGTYSTLWFDSQGFLTATKDFGLVFVALALSLLLTTMMAWGAARSAGEALSGRKDGRGAFGVASVVSLSLIFIAYTLASCHYPYYSVVKAHYMLACAAPMLAFIAVGVGECVRRSGYLVGSAYILAVTMAYLKIFYL